MNDIPRIVKKIAPAFDDFVFNWDYEQYLLIGGYGSGKSYHTAFKVIIKLLEEKRKALVVRQVYETLGEVKCQVKNISCIRCSEE